jgi:hypothetical protein
MAELRLYSTAARLVALVLPISACAGCWEEIEYKGPRTTVAAPPSIPAIQPAETVNPPDTTPVRDTPVAVVPDLPAAELSATPPIPSDISSAANVDDRYALPAAADAPAASDHPPGIAPAAETPIANTPSSGNPPGFMPSTETTGGESQPASLPATTVPPAASPPPHPDAVTTSATESTPKSPALNSRRAAWLLGSWLSLAALANDRGVATQNVPVWFEFTQKAATFLGTSVADLPEPSSPSENSPSKQVVNYLLVNGQRIGRELAKAHGAEESALFEVALKSNILLVLYTPGASAGNSIALAITEAAPKTSLPSEMWQPVVDAIQKKAPPAGVRAAVQKLHTDADKFLTQPAEQKGQ